MKARIRLFVVLMALVAIGMLWIGAGQAEAAPRAAAWQGPRIAIVWPQNGGGAYAPVASSKAVNVSVWPSASVSCATAPDPSVTLWRAKGNEPAVPVDIKGELFLRTHSGVKFPSLEFNTVPADMASDPMNRYYFLLGGWQGNV